MLWSYSEAPITGPSLVFVESGLNSEQVSLMKPFNIEKYISVLEQIVLIARIVLLLNGLYNVTLLYQAI